MSSSTPSSERPSHMSSELHHAAPAQEMTPPFNQQLSLDGSYDNSPPPSAGTGTSTQSLFPASSSTPPPWRRSDPQDRERLTDEFAISRTRGNGPAMFRISSVPQTPRERSRDRTPVAPRSPRDRADDLQFEVRELQRRLRLSEQQAAHMASVARENAGAVKQQ